MKSLLRLSLLGIAATCFGPATLACTCIGDSTPQKELRQCDAVFTGRPIRERIIRIDYSGSGPRMERMREFTFEVSSVLKGGVARRTKVVTPIDSGMCGYAFDLRVPYIVYARLAEGRLHTTICDWTKPLNQARADLKALGPAAAPKDRRPKA